MANENLGAAKSAKNDEFYTQYQDIEKEMNAYLDYNPDVFKGKTIFLPCDDPEWSNFTKYFAQNFKKLDLKKLISTSYAPNSKPPDIPYQPTLFELEDEKFDEVKTQSNGKIFTLTRDRTGDGTINVEDLEWTYLQGDGDFRSEEISKLRDEADIIVTNPPFSLFREFLSWLTELNKDFVIIGNLNAITYKEVFPLFMENKMWLGATRAGVGSMWFVVPDNAADKLGQKVEDGVKYQTIGNSAWFTTIDHGKRHQPLKLMTMADNLKFNKSIKEARYVEYDNYNAIEIPKVDAIPSDFEGIMGVPITFLSKYNPNQFQILGATQRGCHDLVPDKKKYDDYLEMRADGTATGSSGGKTNENGNIEGKDGRKNFFVNSSGHTVQSVYQRIFIRHRKVVK
jgi:hypothetical protein